MSEDGHGNPRSGREPAREPAQRKAVLYARVSSDEQTKGYSLRQQMQRLREHAAAEGYEVVAEHEDPGLSGMFLDRPGLDAVRDLIESGAAAVVLAQDADRITRKAEHRLILDEEAAKHGAVWKALDDWGDDSHEGKLLRFMRGWTAEAESLKTAERSRRGSRRKIAEGTPLCSSPTPRYGFRYAHDADGKRVGYEIDPENMAVVRRIFELLAEGHSVRALAATLDGEGVPTPRGGRQWSRRTLREMALDEVYRPRAAAELAGRVPPEVFARLEPRSVYGVAYSGRVRTRKVSNSAKERTRPSTEEWIGVPVCLDGSGLEAATVDAARRVIEGNRTPRLVGDRFFELAGGPLRCAHCGRRMIGYARRHSGKKAPNPYYRCDSPSRVAKPCPNRRSFPVDALEYEAASLFETTATREALLDLYDRAIAESAGPRACATPTTRPKRLQRGLPSWTPSAAATCAKTPAG